MSRALLVAVALVAVSSTVLAATAPTAILADGQVLRGRFVQHRHLKGFEAPLRSEGRFVLAPGVGLIWRAETPFSILTVITSDGLVQETGGAETARLTATRLPFLARLHDMLEGALAGDWRALETHFVVTHRGDDLAWEVDLTPRRAADPASMPIRFIALKGSRFVEEVRIVRPDGDLDRLVFLDQVAAPAPVTDEEAALLRSVTR